LIVVNKVFIKNFHARTGKKKEMGRKKVSQKEKNRKPTNWQNLQKNHNTRQPPPSQPAAVGGAQQIN